MACDRWLDSLELAGHEIVIPEIIDYEIRRELIRAKKRRGLGRLDDLKAVLDGPDRDVLLAVAAQDRGIADHKLSRHRGHQRGVFADQFRIGEFESDFAARAFTAW